MAASLRTNRLIVYCGPMFAGKTTHLMGEIDRRRRAGQRVLVIKHQNDVRYTEEEICTHSGIKVAALRVACLSMVPESALQGVNAVVVDEGQFFTKVVYYANKWVMDKKDVVVGGLLGGMDGHAFPVMAHLAVTADDLHKLAGACEVCGGVSLFNFLRTPLPEDAPPEAYIGGAEKWNSLCRVCAVQGGYWDHSQEACEMYNVK